MSAGHEHEREPAYNASGALRWRARTTVWARAHLRGIAVAIVIGAIATAGYMLAGGGPTDDGEPAASHDSTQPVIDGPTTPSPGPGSDADRHTPRGDRAEIMEIARNFAVDFAAPGTGHEDWQARVTRWTSDHLTAQLSRTDWRRVESATVMSIRPTTGGPSVVDAVASYDTGLEIGIRLELFEGRWRVTTVAPMKTAY